MLGRQVRSSVIKDVLFESLIGRDRPAYLGDHRIDGTVVVPGAYYVSMVLSAASQVLGEAPYDLKGLVFPEALFLEEEELRPLELVLSRQAEAGYSFQVLSQAEVGAGEDVDWTLHAGGQLHEGVAGPRPRIDREALESRCDAESGGAEPFYDLLWDLGFQLGPGFRWLEWIWRGKGEALCRLRVPAAADDTGAYVLHPGLLDTCFQTVGMALLEGSIPSGGAGSDLYMPLGIERMRYYGSADGRLWCHAVVDSGAGEDRETLRADLRLFDEAGRAVVEVTGLSLKRVNRQQLLRTARQRLDDCFYEIQWQPRVGSRQQSQADFLLPIASIAEQVHRRLGDLESELAPERYQEVLPLMEELSVGYIVQAIDELGWEWRVGDRVSVEQVADACGVVDRHRRLLGRLLEILGEVGELRRVGSAWHVCRVPSRGDPKEDLQTLAARYPNCQAELTLLGRCGGQLAAVLRGESDALQILFPGGSLAQLEKMWQDSPWARLSNGLVQTAISTALAGLPQDRRVRILEIGAGTGGTSAYVLPTLPADRTEYVFTDLSPQFTLHAEKKFTDYPFVRYALLDMERSPQTQGFATDEFDIILAANVLHATSDLCRTLEYVRELLAPQGLLVLLEGTARQRWVDITYGLMEGWWKFRDTHLRPSYPLLASDKWLALLKEVGFDDAQAVSMASTAGSSLQAVILARGPDAARQSSAATARGAGRWIIFADRAGVGARLAELLEERGQSCVVAHAGEGDESGEGDSWNIDPSRGEAFQRLIESVVEDGSPCRGVVHLWSLDSTPSDETTLVTLERDQLLSCGSVLHLVQSLVHSNLSEVPGLWLVTRGAQVVGPDPAAPSVAQAPLWGMGRVLAQEHPEFRCVRVDLALAPASNEVEQLLDEILFRDSERQIALRDGARYVARLVRNGGLDPSRADDFRLRADGTYLITGGLGGLGFKLAHWMVEHGAGHLVMLGRSAVSDATREAVKELEQKGADVLLARADVCSATELAAVFSEFSTSLPPLRGAVHLAAVSERQALKDMAYESFCTVLRPKMLGVWNLHELTKSLDLDFLVCFSSTASVWGSKELCHYAAANSFLDIFAYYRRARGLPGLSINWGIWDKVGKFPAEAQAEVRRVGMRLLDPDDALRGLGLILGTEVSQGTIASVDWSVFKPIYEFTGEGAFLTQIEAASRPADPRAVERWRRLLRLLPEVTPGKRRELLVEHLQAEVARILGFKGMDAVDPKQGFFEMGMDSLTGIELKSQLELGLGQTLPSTLVFNYPNVEALAEYISAEVLGMVLERQTPRSTQEEVNRLLGPQLDAVLEEELAAVEDLLSRD